ncbi:MAG: glycosyltransferase family 1 protein [Thermoanaerobaculia bacterium]
MARPLWYRRLRAFLSPIHPHRLIARFQHQLHRMGYFHVRLWVVGMHPRRVLATLRWASACAAAIRRRRREKRLTVAVDISAFWERRTGIGWYLYRILEHLAERDDVRLRLYGLDLIAKHDRPPPVVTPPAGSAIEAVGYRVPDNLSFVDYYLTDRLLAVQDRLIAADSNDVVFAPNYYPPWWFGRCRGRLVATVHDLSIERVPETMRESTRRDLAGHLRSTLERAERVLTDSETVRGELVDSGLAEASRVVAVHLGPGTLVAAGLAEGGELPPGVPEDYVLHVGTLEPRKDLPTLFEAWRELRRRSVAVPGLVLCGGFGWKTEEVRSAMADGVEEGWILHLGYVEDEQVVALYRGASAVVLPSIYEGFGLPALEAMIAGIPLVCSDIPVLREIAGAAALYAPPGQPEKWADRLTELLESAELRSDLACRGRERALKFDWQRTAGETVAVWMEAAGRAPAAGAPGADET